MVEIALHSLGKNNLLCKRAYGSVRADGQNKNVSIECRL